MANLLAAGMPFAARPRSGILYESPFLIIKKVHQEAVNPRAPPRGRVVAASRAALAPGAVGRRHRQRRRSDLRDEGALFVRPHTVPIVMDIRERTEALSPCRSRPDVERMAVRDAQADEVGADVAERDIGERTADTGRPGRQASRSAVDGDVAPHENLFVDERRGRQQSRSRDEDGNPLLHVPLP
ncbi:hypothetical protein [Tahibacter soli]|uniref:Uncharacterized protein n=1 Tax=Tahibacter soli TaxID=2983605 RepID=A0A9X4BIZ6_9GAMM|nr:hypothetical protein [Tahibacter soli]MDC8012732.1 hypothetical protein [Tahibacter soli]